MRKHENSKGSESAIGAFHRCAARLSAKRIARSVASAAFLVALAVGASSSSMRAADTAAPLTKQQVKELIKTANTPEEHMKLGQYYRYEADKFKSEAQEHKEMSAEYAGRPLPKGYPMSEHCNDLSGYLTRAAQKAERLASMHEEMAKTAEK
jgi:hypothetical protein